MGHVVEILKMFFEKYFIKSVLSAIFAIATYTYYPSFYAKVKSESEVLYWIFLFLVSFAIVHSIHVSYSVLFEKFKNRNFTRKKCEENYKTSMETIWSNVDRLPDESISIIVKLIETNNSKAYLCSTDKMHIVLASNLFIVSSFILTNNTEIDKYMLDSKLTDINEHHKREKNTLWRVEVLQIKLQDDFYKILKHSYEKYGRISHFA